MTQAMSIYLAPKSGPGQTLVMDSNKTAREQMLAEFARIEALPVDQLDAEGARLFRTAGMRVYGRYAQYLSWNPAAAAKVKIAALRGVK